MRVPAERAFEESEVARGALNFQHFILANGIFLYPNPHDLEVHTKITDRKVKIIIQWG